MSADGAMTDLFDTVRRLALRQADMAADAFRFGAFPATAVQLERDLGLDAKGRDALCTMLAVELGAELGDDAGAAVTLGDLTSVAARALAAKFVAPPPAIDFATAALNAAFLAEDRHDRVGICVSVPGRPRERSPMVFWIAAPDLSFVERANLAENIARRLNRDTRPLTPR